MNDGKKKPVSVGPARRAAFEELKRRGSLLRFGSHQAYRHVLQTLSIQTGLDLSQPSTFVIRITDRCPLRCRHCTDWSADSTGELTTGQWSDILDDIARWPGSCHTILTGGEPLQRDDLDQLARHATRRGLTCTVFTHGGNLGPARVARLVDAGVRCLRISLDGIGQTHDTFRGASGLYDAVLRNIRDARKTFPSLAVVLGAVIVEPNVDQIGSLVRLAGDLDLDGIEFMVLYPSFYDRSSPDPHWYRGHPAWPTDPSRVERALAEVGELRRQGYPVLNLPGQLDLFARYYADPTARFDDVPCLGLHTKVNITSRGNLFACNKERGSLVGRSLREVWNSDELRTMRKRATSCGLPCAIACNFQQPFLSRVRLLGRVLRR